MKLFQKINACFLLTTIFLCCGCQTQTAEEDYGKENLVQENDTTNQTKSVEENTQPTPNTCIDWIGFYGEQTRELDSIVKKKSYKIKSEGQDEYNSANKLQGAYVLTDKNMPIKKVGILAKYLAYKLCLSDNKQFNGILMDCQRRKIQVVIARSNKNYNNEAWAVVYNISPGNKKGELITLDFTK